MACDAFTVLMLHCNGADGSTTFTDSSASAHTVTANNQSQIDTAQSKFGGASGLFDGTTDNLSVPDHANWDLGTGDFTLETWIRFNSVAGNQIIFGRNGINDFRLVFIGSLTQLELSLEGSVILSPVWGPSTNTWYHVVAIRTGTTVRLFIDGTQLGTDGTSSADIQGTSALLIGGDGAGNDVNGWMDEIRISKGIARWTSNFTPPTSEYCQDRVNIHIIGRGMMRGTMRGSNQ